MCVTVRLSVAVCLLVSSIQAAAPQSPLVAREDWRETPPAEPMTQAHVAHPDLELMTIGPGAGSLRKSHHDQPADDPYYVWSGNAAGTWAVALRHRRALLDLSRGGAVRWRSRQSGFRQLHPIVQLEDGQWLVADQADGASEEWRVKTFPMAELTWRTLDPATIVEGKSVSRPPLARIAAVGFTDLMRGGGSPASSRLDWIEIYGLAVPR
jgi:hypothetical protein